MVNLSSQATSSVESKTVESMPCGAGETAVDLSQFTEVELAQALMAKLSITDKDWHRLKANRKARASEQAIAALLFLLKDQPEEALPRLQQAAGWLDRSISAPPCPTHGK